MQSLLYTTLRRDNPLKVLVGNSPPASFLQQIFAAYHPEVAQIESYGVFPELESRRKWGLNKVKGNNNPSPTLSSLKSSSGS